ncbi:MAG: CPBP family intramembrane metalloprotease [Roseivirga sp.]|nr:CPBP family intramembrane metalloprotease [Roseivirga sp.]
MYLLHVVKLVRRHKLAFVFALATGLVLVAFGLYHGTMPKVIAYLSTLVACFLVSEFIHYHGKIKLDAWRIDRPHMELKVVLICELIVVLLLSWWFVLANPQSMTPPLKLAILVIRLLFAFPIFFLIYFLAVRKYSLAQLGFRFKYWFVSIPLIVIIGGVSYMGFPEGIQFEDMLEEHGYLAFLTLGFLTAAIPEEITRHLFQSRLSVVMKSKSFGWFFASLVWALLHIPSFGNSSGDYVSASLSAIGILPIGLFWGYLNQRHRSIIPSILIHGTNLWGLQNIF